MVHVYPLLFARYTERVEERRFRIGPMVEWAAAAFGVIALMWLVSVSVQRVLGPGVEAALVDTPSALPPGIPAGAISVPVMYLLDGREIRQGELQTRLHTLLPERLADGPAQKSTAEFGERYTRTYVVQGTRIYVVCERMEPGGPMRVAGIYLP